MYYHYIPDTLLNIHFYLKKNSSRKIQIPQICFKTSGWKSTVCFSNCDYFLIQVAVWPCSFSKTQGKNEQVTLNKNLKYSKITDNEIFNFGWHSTNLCSTCFSTCTSETLIQRVTWAFFKTWTWLHLQRRAEVVWNFCCRRTAERQIPPPIRVSTEFGNGVGFCLFVKRWEQANRNCELFFLPALETGSHSRQMFMWWRAVTEAHCASACTVSA